MWLSVWVHGSLFFFVALAFLAYVYPCMAPWPSFALAAEVKHADLVYSSKQDIVAAVAALNVMKDRMAVAISSVNGE